eukprot:1374485-Rhodomonas_salina.2
MEHFWRQKAFVRGRSVPGGAAAARGGRNARWPVVQYLGAVPSVVVHLGAAAGSVVQYLGARGSVVQYLEAVGPWAVLRGPYGSALLSNARARRCSTVMIRNKPPTHV